MVEVRQAVRGDAVAISALAREAQAMHAAAHPAIFKPASAATFPPAQVATLMAQPEHLFWVSGVDGTVAGYA